MQKSLINEFKNSSSTLFHSTVLGTNSTLAQRSKEQQIYKSRIAHLPADHREDLSRKLDFLVVFQAIEIQRLSQQISFLRGRVREQQGRTLNANSYQVQIRQLMEKCNKLENEKYSYREQLAQTKDASQNIFNQLSILKSRYADVDFCIAEKYKLEKARNEELCLQIEKWKSRYNSLQKIKGQQNDGYRRLLQTQKQSMLNREAKDFLVKFQLQKQQLLGKLRDRKEQLDQKDLQIKKLQNHYEQLQVRNREDNSKMESYEQKVALLSQQTFRLNQLVRIKHQQIKNLKLMHDDFSIRMSRFTSLDQTTNQLSEKLRYVQDENDELRQQNRRLSDNLSQLKRKMSETQRHQFQNQQLKNDIETKLKALERKDRKIIALEEELKETQYCSQQINQIKQQNQNLRYDILDLQERIDAKIEQLQRVKEQQMGFLRWRDDFNKKIQTKLNEYQQAYRSLQYQYSQFRTSSQKSIQKSNEYQLQAKQLAIQMKEKDYKISSLQNELKQLQMKSKTKQAETKQLLKELQEHLFVQRKKFQQKIKQAEIAIRQKSQSQIRQLQSKSRQSQAKARQIQSKFKDYQLANSSYEQRARNLQAQCIDLQNWGRSLQTNNHHLELHVQDLQFHINQMQEENASLKNFLGNQQEFYQNAEKKYFEIGQDMKSLKIRLQNIEKILISLKTSVGLKIKSAEDFDYKLHHIQQKYQELYEWFLAVAGSFQKSKDVDRSRDSPTKTPYHNFFGNYNQSSRLSPYKDQSSHQSSHLHRAKSLQRTRQNINIGNRDQEIPVDFLIKYVLLCIQVEGLRKRVGDKNAKVESMRNSIVVKGYPQSNGFFTNRQPSAGKRNIYY